MDPTPWTPDFDWLWGSGVEDPVATLRLHVQHPDPDLVEASVTRFVGGLSSDSNGVRGSGGWAVHPRPELSTPGIAVLDLVSGGQDVADGIEAAADAAFESMTRTKGVRLRWEQLPLETSPPVRSD